jgi:hypothetical protein
MKGGSDAEYVAQFLMKSWPVGWHPPESVEVRQGEYREGEYREGFTIVFKARASSTSPTDATSTRPDEPKDSRSISSTPNDWVPLEFVNPNWSKNKRAAIEWAWNYMRRTGTTPADMAKALGVQEKHFAKYFRENPPALFESTANKIWKYKGDVDP